MFSHASCLECQGVIERSKAASLKRQRFEERVSSNLHQPEIDLDIASAKQLNFQGTPSFIVGRTAPTSVEGLAIRGPLPYEEFQAKIDQFIGKTSTAGRQVAANHNEARQCRSKVCAFRSSLRREGSGSATVMEE